MMSRTYRQGRKSRNIKRYIALGAVRHENDCFITWDGSFQTMWSGTYVGADTYAEYVKLAVSEHHKDGGQRNTPRYVRHEDVRSQRTAHERAIANAWKSGDWDVVLQGLRKDASWAYW